MSHEPVQTMLGFVQIGVAPWFVAVRTMVDGWPTRMVEGVAVMVTTTPLALPAGAGGVVVVVLNEETLLVAGAGGVAQPASASIITIAARVVMCPHARSRRISASQASARTERAPRLAGRRGTPGAGCQASFQNLYAGAPSS